MVNGSSKGAAQPARPQPSKSTPAAAGSAASVGRNNSSANSRPTASAVRSGNNRQNPQRNKQARRRDETPAATVGPSQKRTRDNAVDVEDSVNDGGSMDSKYGTVTSSAAAAGRDGSTRSNAAAPPSGAPAGSSKPPPPDNDRSVPLSNSFLIASHRTIVATAERQLKAIAHSIVRAEIACAKMKALNDSGKPARSLVPRVTISLPKGLETYVQQIEKKFAEAAIAATITLAAARSEELQLAKNSFDGAYQEAAINIAEASALAKSEYDRAYRSVEHLRVSPPVNAPSSDLGRLIEGKENSSVSPHQQRDPNSLVRPSADVKSNGNSPPAAAVSAAAAAAAGAATTSSAASVAGNGAVSPASAPAPMDAPPPPPASAATSAAASMQPDTHSSSLAEWKARVDRSESNAKRLLYDASAFAMRSADAKRKAAAERKAAEEERLKQAQLASLQDPSLTRDSIVQLVDARIDARAKGSSPNVASRSGNVQRPKTAGNRPPARGRSARGRPAPRQSRNPQVPSSRNTSNMPSARGRGGSFRGGRASRGRNSQRGRSQEAPPSQNGQPQAPQRGTPHLRGRARGAGRGRGQRARGGNASSCGSER